MNIKLTNRERELLAAFATKQHEGAKDNLGTRTPLHVVERIRTEYVDSPEGDAWMWTDGGDEYKVFDNFNSMIVFARNQDSKDYPMYIDVMNEHVESDNGESIWIDDEEAYCQAYGIKACKVKTIKYTEPVAFFFIRDEAVRYKDGYQAHNCGDCRIYTYGLGYSNDGDMPVFRSLLMRMGEAINAETNKEEV